MLKKSRKLYNSFSFSELEQQATLEQSEVTYDNQGLPLYNWMQTYSFFCKLSLVTSKNRLPGLKTGQQNDDYSLMTRKQNIEQLSALIAGQPVAALRISVENQKFNIVSWEANNPLYGCIILQKIDD